MEYMLGKVIEVDCWRRNWEGSGKEAVEKATKEAGEGPKEIETDEEAKQLEEKLGKGIINKLRTKEALGK